MTTETITAVELSKAFRLINHGPTTLISARYNGTDNVMAASWVCALDYAPPKLTLVLDKMACTRELIEKSGQFVVQIPTVAQLALTHHAGTHSLRTDPQKMAHPAVQIFEMPGIDMPFIEGCAGWLTCRVIPERHNQNTYDLFIGEKSQVPGRIHESSATGAGSLVPLTRPGEACTILPAASFMPLERG